ncbi:MAG: hypothetical protein ACKV2T_27905 [Kofleriaceae bacterium]
MTAFHQVFREIAEREYLMFGLDGPRGASRGTFAVRELYCSDPQCGCSTVVLLVMQATPQERVAALIPWDLDDPNLPSLDTTGPADRLAKDLLGVVHDHIRDDGYRETLRRHQSLWRSAVVDRTDPAHARLLELRGGTPPRRPRAPREKPPASKTGVEIAIAQRARDAGSKAQKKFSAQIKKVEGLRARVRQWREQRPNIDRGVALYHAELTTQRGLARQFVEGLDALLVAGTVAKKARAKLERLVCTIVVDLIEDGHEDLKAIHDRYAQHSYDTEASAFESDAVASLKAMMEVMGVDLGDDVRTMDDVAAVMEREREKQVEENVTGERRRGGRKKTRKQIEREMLAESQQRDASKVLQDVYRKLAQALHPDLERDDTERARKTALMQDVNAAYAKKDLLRLLELQLTFEKVDESARDIAEDRLVHYTRILEQQARELTSELEDLELPFRVQLDRPPPMRISPNDILAALHHDTIDLRETIAMQRRDLEAIADPKRLQAWLRTVPDLRRSGRDMPF